MKIKLISKLSCAIPLSLLLLLASCEKFLEVDRSPDLVPTDYVFTTDKTAIAAITGLYLQMRSQNNILSNGGLSVYASLLADDIYNTTSNSVNDPFYQDALLSTNSTVNGSFWSVAYRNIYHANAILEGISRSNSLTDTSLRSKTPFGLNNRSNAFTIAGFQRSIPRARVCITK